MKIKIKMFENMTCEGCTPTNETHEMVTNANAKQTTPWACVIAIVYFVGIFGNAAAIVAIRRGVRRMRNRKHLLLLTTLAVNDLVALIGMAALMALQRAVTSICQTRAFCAARVLLRIFGLGSVSIAVVMAMERWYALTQPFLYQKHITYRVVRWSLIWSWSAAAIMTSFPLLGFGMYYHADGSRYKCARYRSADTPDDLAYAILYLVFGYVLCAILVYCNLAVVRALYRAGTSSAGDSRTGIAVVRRVSRARQQRTPSSSVAAHAATLEEVTFSRLMLILSVLFMICWLPQMITTTVYLLRRGDNLDRFAHLANLSDLLMLLNYTLDPYIYVLLRGNRCPAKKTFEEIFKLPSMIQSFKSRKQAAKSCPQDRLVSAYDNPSNASYSSAKTELKDILVTLQPDNEEESSARDVQQELIDQDAV